MGTPSSEYVRHTFLHLDMQAEVKHVAIAIQICIQVMKHLVISLTAEAKLS